jgi:hypothetical protein
VAAVYEAIKEELPVLDLPGCNLDGLIVRVVQHLNLEPLPRVIQVSDRIDETLHDVQFVIDRELDQHGGKVLEGPLWNGPLLAKSPVQIDHEESVQAEEAKNSQDGEIRIENQLPDKGYGLPRQRDHGVKKSHVVSLPISKRAPGGDYRSA